MCQIYHEVGSLTIVKQELEKNKIHHFNSLKEVMDFQASYRDLKERIVENHKNLIQREKEELEVQMAQIKQAISIQTDMTTSKLLSRKEDLNISIKNLPNSESSGLTQGIISAIKRWKLASKPHKLEKNFDRLVLKSVQNLLSLYELDFSRYSYITSNTEEAINKSASTSLQELGHLKSTVDQLNTFILGALGEHQVVKELKTLPDDFHLINNLEIHFPRGIYGGPSLGYIKSVQMDHVLIGPPGIFLIETKNWSLNSLTDQELFSPVQQIKRAGYAMYKLLNHSTLYDDSTLASHHWGDRKIPVRNVIVFINSKPKEKFKYVTILTLSELLGYINYFDPTLSVAESQDITEHLLNYMD